jgi:hypothetical protein
MKTILQIVVDHNELCGWYFDSIEEATEARAYASANGLSIITDDEISVLPTGEILTSAYEFSDFYSRVQAA